MVKNYCLHGRRLDSTADGYILGADLFLGRWRKVVD
jgi:hypothetical protein